MELYTGIHSLVKTLDDGTVVIRHEGLCRKFKAQESDNNLVKKYPDIIRWWDKIKNFPNNPEDFTCGSPHKAYFKCPDCGLTICKRISDAFSIDENGLLEVFDCPYCNGRTVPGINSLKALYPELAKECVSKVDTDRVSIEATNSYDWKCPNCNGVYPAVVALRVKGNGCPYCNNNKVLPGYNSFKVLYPEIMKEEWLELENLFIGVDADEHLPTSPKNAWFKCPICDYKYMMSFANRTMKNKRGHNPCPFCNGRRQMRMHYI